MIRNPDHRLLLSSSDSVKSTPSDPTTAGDYRRQPVILKKSSRNKPCIAEIAGGKTAECAAILCCCPCGLLDLLILAVVRLPAGLCRKALRKRLLRRRTKKAKMLLESSSGLNSDSGSGSGAGSDGWSSAFGSSSDDEFVEFAGFHGGVVMVVGDRVPAKSPSAEVIELEEEVWSKFYGRGFWRSPSQKDEE